MCIGIVAFAMVAILGVLPLGLGVQRQNREETIVEQEGPLWVDLIRRGGIGWERRVGGWGGRQEHAAAGERVCV